MQRVLRFVIVVAAMVFTGAACGNDDGASVRETGAASGSGSASASGSASGSGTASGAAEDCEVVGGTTESETAEIHAELTEYEIALDETTVAAGRIKFEATNEGDEPHEIAIVRASDAAKLPTADDGGADDAVLGDDLIGEIEPFASGKECAGTFELTAGTYAVICNIVEEEANGEIEAHYEKGMFTTLRVS